MLNSNAEEDYLLNSNIDDEMLLNSNSNVVNMLDDPINDEEFDLVQLDEPPAANERITP